jgi:hypothetical protein
MRGFLKASGVIRQCTRCGTLRDTEHEPEFCGSCFFEGVMWVWTRTLPLADISDDALIATDPLENFLVALVGQSASHDC